MPRPTDEYLATLTENTRQYILDIEAKIERLCSDYAKLHGVVSCYIDADPQVRGEAYRDLVGTMEHLAGADEAMGWPACYRRIELKLEEAKAKVERLRKAACPGCAKGLPVRLDAVSGAIHPFPELVNGTVRWNWLAFSTCTAAEAAGEE